ncbi:MAG TPA: hypothetical protein VJU87_08780 [Gemmatimonadaceae bacterium]|nr:hypothetical protein [Gemmatimonadaceae bacterium]
MSKRAMLAMSLAAVVVIASGACGVDSPPLSPLTMGGGSAGTAGGPGPVTLPGAIGVHALQRDQALDSDHSWAFVVGPAGGRAHDPVTGLTMSFAQKAVLVRMKITVTALAGTDAAYRFEPHGLQFAAPVTLSQSLRGMRQWNGDTTLAALTGAYFRDQQPQVDSTGAILVSELLPATVDAHGTVSFQIQHFSGYTVASAVRDTSRDGGTR